MKCVFNLCKPTFEQQSIIRNISVCHTAYISIFPYDLRNKQRSGRHTELTGWSLWKWLFNVKCGEKNLIHCQHFKWHCHVAYTAHIHQTHLLLLFPHSLTERLSGPCNSLAGVTRIYVWYIWEIHLTKHVSPDI